MNIIARVKILKGYKKVVEYEKATYTVRYYKPAEVARMFLEVFDKIMQQAINKRSKV